MQNDLKLIAVQSFIDQKIIEREIAWKKIVEEKQKLEEKQNIEKSILAELNGILLGLKVGDRIYLRDKSTEFRVWRLKKICTIARGFDEDHDACNLITVEGTPEIIAYYDYLKLENAHKWVFVPVLDSLEQTENLIRGFYSDQKSILFDNISR